jgi:hypothetical protein
MTAPTAVNTFWTAEEFLKREFPSKEPLIEGLLNMRDLVTLAARRRNGKTTLLTNIPVALATAQDYLNYRIPQTRRSLGFYLEDDPGEYQEKLKRIIADRATGDRIRIMMRDDFMKSGIAINAADTGFRAAVHTAAEIHQPDLITFDNLSHLVRGNYNDSQVIDNLMQFCYELTQLYNAAVIIAAHPRKEDFKCRVDLEKYPESFFEAVMVSSHFVNSTGSLWGLQRRENEAIFLGGRQRADGRQSWCYIEKDDQDWFRVRNDVAANLAGFLRSSTNRAEAWKLLPDPPSSFRYNEGERLVKNVMRSSSTYDAFIREAKRLNVIVDCDSGFMKNPGAAFAECAKAA